VGQARVIDGDTIAIGAQHIRLDGVDAEELNEPNGRIAKAMTMLIIGFDPVTCKLSGYKSYERVVATCYNKNGEDIGAELIKAGRALDCARYSGGKYRSLEPEGARAKLIQKSYCWR
jgi:endonuclease YncB( thermonuclease family)